MFFSLYFSVIVTFFKNVTEILEWRKKYHIAHNIIKIRDLKQRLFLKASFLNVQVFY